MIGATTLQEIKHIEDVKVIKTFFFDIFPEEPNYDCVEFLNSVTGQHNYDILKYYFVKVSEDIIGFCGFYSEKKDEVWLGWFGIKPAYRRKGYAQAALLEVLNIAKGLGYRYCRLYTDKKINAAACSLYFKNGFITDSCYKDDFITMVLDLNNEVVPTHKYWAGIPLGFESEYPREC